MKTLYIPNYSPDGAIESWESITGRSLRAIHRAMCARLGEIRAERAYDTRDDRQDPTIVCSLYEGHDRIVASDGRVIYSNR